jgi:hypothetical protein
MAVILVTATPWGPAPTAQTRVIEVPQKRPKLDCVKYPPELVGTFKQTLVFERGDHVQTDVTTGSVTWKLQDVSRESHQPKGDPWAKFYAKAKCPVHFYMVSQGELMVDTEVHYERPMSCQGRGRTPNPYDARQVLFMYSAIFIADNGYLINIGAGDTDMGKNTVTKTCKDRDGRRSTFSPIEEQMNPNFIRIQDRTGPYVYGVHGSIDTPIKVSPNHTITARWDFAAPSPAP